MKTLYALLWKEFICHIKRPISLLFEFGIVVLMWYSATEHIEHNINMKIDIKKAEPEERSIDIQRSYLALYLPATNFTRSLFYNESIKGIEYTTVEEYEEYMYYEKEWIYFIGTFTFYEMDGKQYLNETRLTRLMQNGFLIEVTRMQQIPQVSINPLKMFNKFIWQAFITNIGDRSDSLPEISTVEMKWGEEMSITLVEVVFEISATIALLYPLFLLIKNIVAEKQSKLLELMRIAGVNKRDYFLAAFIFKFLSLIPFIVLFTKAYGQLIDTPLTVLLLLLYVTSSILFVMALSVLFTRSDIASGFFAVMWFITVPIQFSGDFIFKYDISRAIVASCVFLPPNCALLFFTAKTSFLAASYKKKLAFDTLFTKTPMMESVSAGHFLVAMGCGALFWVLFIAYVGEVWPWQDGIPKPFHFPISYFFKRKEEKSVQIEEGDQVYFEKVNAENLEQAIGIEKVRKKYESTGDVVLKSISLQVYRGQITILLGHNGAGKTTLFNIICGMFSPTSGKILVNGFNIKTDTKAARKRLGMCPQSEILFENLSVAYHLYFFGLLKEGKISALNAEISNILKLLNLEDKRTFLPKQLSGGMKRRLQLAIALIGGTDTLILDEPTSGLDVETRRSVWDFLLSVRKQYAILLTTHHMEEADILGDRIAIMSHGEIKCCGSPMFLKRVFGLGYVLRFEKRAEFKGVECRAFLQKHFNELQTVKESEYEFVCKIRKEESAKLAKFFDVASKMRDELGFTSIGLTASTMDDVFIQVGVLFEKQEKSDMSEIRQLKEISLQKPSNLSLFKIIFIKRFTYMKHKWLISLIIVLFCAATSLLDEYLLGSFVRSSIFLPELKFLPDKLNCICLGEESYCDYVQKMGESFGANFKFVRSLTIDSVRKSPEDFRETPVIAFKCENIPMQSKDCQISNITLVVEFFSAEFVLETVAINMLLALRLNKSLDRPIFKYSIILQRDYGTVLNSIPILFVLFNIFFSLQPLIQPSSERITNVKMLQLMTGLPVSIYWLANFVFDIIALLLLSLPFFIIFATNVIEGFSFFAHGGKQIATLLISVIVFYISSTSMAHLLSLFTSSVSSVVILEIVAMVIKFLISPLLSKFIRSPLTLLLEQLPILRVTSTAFNISLFSQKIYFCESVIFNIYTKACVKGRPFSLAKDCCKTSPNSSNVGSIDYSGIDYLEITIGILIQALIAIACFVSLILIETFKSFRRVAQEYQARDADDEDVAAERMRTEQIIREGKMESQALVAYNLTKVYGHSIVVDHLSFSVSKNQCFGLLGVNGAGKTTTFKMLIGELAATYGEAFIGKLSLFDDRLEYLRQIGYCPQFDSFVNNLTGTENLKLFAKLRGYKGKEVNSIVTSVINFVDLQDHASKEANLCSGGNKRKLSIGMALIGFPKLIFLDEPTSSVDPVARRKIWAIIEALSSGLDCSFVLCSHSMDECQQLCNIISILTKGKFKCMGSTQHLKEKLGKGYTVILKIDQTINNGDLVSAEMKLRFPNAVLRETHQSAIEYTIPALWTSLGEIFASLEQMKEEFKLEDFQVKDTELEQIFLQIAKEK